MTLQTDWAGGFGLRNEKAMTWAEIKEAVKKAGVRDDEEIGSIQCENGDGDHTFHKVRLGRTLKVNWRIKAVANGNRVFRQTGRQGD